MDYNIPAPASNCIMVRDGKGYWTTPWYLFINQLFDTSGGPSGVIDVPHGGTDLTSVAQGDMLYGSAADTYALLNKSATASYLSNGGSSNNPEWTAKAALTKTDDTNVTLTLSAGAPSAVLTPTSITVGWSGLLALNRGGTNANNSTAISGTFLRGDGTGYASSTLTLPNTLTVNQVLYGTSANVVGASSAFTFGAIANGLTLTAGTVSDAVTHTFSRTTTDATSGTKAMMRFGTAQADPASNSSASYSAVWITNQSPATNSVNFTGSILGSFYEATHRGSGTLTTLSGMQANVVQSAGAGAITVLRTINANMSVSASSTLVTGFQPNIAVGAAGAITTYAGLDVPTTGTITAGGAITSAFGARVANQGKTGVTNAVGLALNNQSGAATSNTVLLLGTLTAPSGTYSIRNASTNQNTHAGSSFFGGTTSPTALVHVAAGTTAASTAPIKLTSGTSMTSAEAGAVEFTTDDLFFTITTGTARKRVTMADPVAGLTSGRLPVVTTNGRLTDSANATCDTSGNAVFAGATQILGNNTAATLLDVNFKGGSNSGVGVLTRYVKGGSDKFYFGHDSAVNGGTGDGPALYANTGLGFKLYTNAALLADFGSATITLSNAVNIAVNTSTGTKIGTATNQKLGFWNAAPIVQPTTAGTAATFVANTSNIADDTATFDGYTLGQVVKALRNAGILA